MYLDGRNIKLSDDPRENLMELDEVFYQVDFLDHNKKYVQGGNGIVFNFADEQGGEEFVIKFSKFSYEMADLDWRINNRLIRFQREIEALYVAENNGISGVVKIVGFGDYLIDNQTFPYYLMEKCDYTLKHYLDHDGQDLDIVQKTLLCQKILIGVQQLHAYKIYHRDIKHDNILFMGGEPLISDLGLADYRDSDYRINEKGEIIGPTGWFSPEAINKYLVEKTANINGFDCTIDEKSEVFQMGKLFWYIYQGNIPVGQVDYEDFVPQNKIIYSILYDMLAYSKSRRLTTESVAQQIGEFLAVN